MTINNEIDDAKKVLTYWRTIEFLQQDKFEPPKRLKKGNQLYFVLSKLREEESENGTSLLYETILKALKEEPKNNDLKTWGDLSVYFGLVQRQACIDKLVSILNVKEEDSPIEEDPDSILLGCFKMNPEGEYKQGSLSISTMVWAINKLVNGSADDLDSAVDNSRYKNEMRSLEKEFFGFGKPLEEPVPDEKVIKKEPKVEESAIPPKFSEDSLTLNRIKQVASEITDRYRTCLSEPHGKEQEEKKNYILLKAQFLKEQSENSNCDDFDNWLAFDFFSDDLKLVRNALAEADLDVPMVSELKNYILVPKKANDEWKRIDVLHPNGPDRIQGFFSAALGIENYPLGKWPVRFSPVLMQQLAINYAISADKMPIRNNAIFSVNGPPGTGKTTLLREIIASNTVSKAELLMKYDDPDDAFLTYEIIPGPERQTKYWDHWHKLKDDRINDLSIIITSSNNKAVENITKKLPLTEEITKGLKEDEKDDEKTKSNLSEIRNMFTVNESSGNEFLYRGNTEEKKSDFVFKKNKLEGDYKDIFFSEYANDLFGEDVWGLVSVPLGRKSNIKEFYYNVLKRMDFDLFCKNDVIRKRKEKYKLVRDEFKEQLKKVKDLREKLKEGRNSQSPISEALIKDLFCPDCAISTLAHVSNPWLTEEFNREREKLFHHALLFIKEFVLSSISCWDNFRVLACYWGYFKVKEGPVPEIRDERIITAAYQTLLLMIPAVSSTFASVGNMFRDIRKPSVFGTLIVDEAGQAEPFAAIGAMFRSRRAIVVGDPKQLQPVITDDTKLLKRRLFQEEFYIPYKDENLSVQSFSDALNPVGSYIRDFGSEEEPTWVGSPLVVHRRCIDPMFSISNRLSYDGIMKQRTKQPSVEKKFLFDSSMWIHYSGDEVSRKNHFVDCQGFYAAVLLDHAFGRCEKNPSVYIISPFKTVIAGMKKTIGNLIKEKRSEFESLANGLEKNKDWLEDHIGTVHTVQGREADEVIFLLGCDRDSHRAMEWVNVNLVNVAVSRAKYRLYVIGDAKAWSEKNDYLRCVLSSKGMILAEDLPLPL